MTIKKKLTLLLILFTFCSTSCGYKKLNNEENNYYLSNITITGEKKIGQIIKQSLKTYSFEESPTRINLSLSVAKNKIIKNKDAAGVINNYLITIVVEASIENEKTGNILNKNFSKSLDFKAKSNHSETLITENKTTSIISNSLAEQITDYLLDYSN